MTPIRYISVFSGIEAASVAWQPLGFEPIAFSEIDPFPCAVLQKHFPDVPNLGDITQIDWNKYDGTIDLLVGGSPCQSFSVAGKREGLQGESRLMFEYIRAVRELRPSIFVWENVPGAFSSENGQAFGQLLRELDECGYGMAWRVLDAQFFGLAQRRKRVFLVGCLGNPKRAAEILFESESVYGDLKPSREKREELTASAKKSVRTSSEKCLTPWDCQSKRIHSIDGVAPSLQHGDGGGVYNPTIAQPIGFAWYAGGKATNLGAGEEQSPTLIANGNPPATCYAIVGNIIDRKDENGGNGMGVAEEVCYTLTAADRHAVCMTQYGEELAGALCARADSSPCADRGQNIVCMQDGNFTNGEDVIGPLCARDHKGVGNEYVNEGKVVTNGYVVRRLMPIECERLQGFPDNYTNIEYKGAPAKDGPRYKALGNSMAVPVMRWIGERIAKSADVA